MFMNKWPGIPLIFHINKPPLVKQKVLGSPAKLCMLPHLQNVCKKMLLLIQIISQIQN
jgi:hypothetical protein